VCGGTLDDLCDHFEVQAWKGGDLSIALAVSVRSTEDVNELGCPPARSLVTGDLDHQTATAGGGELDMVTDVEHFFSLLPP